MSWPTTPLIVAAKMGHTDMVALLMDRGADIKGVSKVSTRPPSVYLMLYITAHAHRHLCLDVRTACVRQRQHTNTCSMLYLLCRRA